MSSTRIGISLGPLVSTRQLVEFSSIADKNGAIDSIWVPESWGRESFSSLGSLSQVTRKVKLGTSIVSMYARTPATVAMAAVTLDGLSNGRAVIGLGASTETIVENFHGIRYEKPIGRIREYVTCIRKLISGERVNFDGNYFRIRNFKLLENPVRPSIPIYLAAINEKMLSTALDIADGILLYLRPLSELELVTEKIKAHSRGNNIEIALSIICSVSEDSIGARLRAKKTLAFYISVGKYYREFIARNGYENEVSRIIASYANDGLDAAANCVPDPMLDSLSIAGTRDECRKRLAEFSSKGLTLAILQFNPVGDAESSFREMMTIL